MSRFLSYTIYLIKKYNVEPILFLFMIARNLYMPTPVTQLITDKICLNDYELDPFFCKRINEKNLTKLAIDIMEKNSDYQFPDLDNSTTTEYPPDYSTTELSQDYSTPFSQDSLKILISNSLDHQNNTDDSESKGNRSNNNKDNDKDDDKDKGSKDDDDKDKSDKENDNKDDKDGKDNKNMTKYKDFLEKTTKELEKSKNNILGDTVNYMMYGQMILSIPSILAAIFLGPWLDMHGIAPKIVLLLTTCASLFEAVVILLNLIFFEAHAAFVLIAHILNGLTGGSMLCMTAVFTIAMKETPLEERTFRFTIIELFMVLPNPIANYLSSLLLPLTPWLIKTQDRNFLPIILISIICYLICLAFILLVLGEVKEVCSPNDSILKRASLRTSLQPLSVDYLSCGTMRAEPVLHYVNSGFEEDENNKDFKLNLEKSHRDDNNNSNFLGSELKAQKERSLSLHQSLPVLNAKNLTKGEMAKSLFQLRNATAMVKTTLKRREEKAHKLIWLIIIIYVIILVCSMGIPLIMLPFAQKVYQMTAEDFMRKDSIGHLALGLITTALLAGLHKIELEDTITIIIGLISLFSLNALRGIILHPIGLYISYVTGCVYLCCIVACRGLCSKIIPEKEIGTMMGVMSVFYATSPVLGSFMYTQIYRLSIEFYPGAPFLAGAFFVLISIIMAIYLHVRYRKYKTKMASNNSTIN